MAIPFTCPHCGNQTTVADEYAGRTGPCAQCGQTVSIPVGMGMSPQPTAKAGKSSGPLFAILGVVAVLVLLCGGGVFYVISQTVSNARDAANRARLSNNLRQIGLALHNYHDIHGRLPAGAYGPDALAPEERLSWMVEILPYMEQRSLYDQFNHEEAWDSPTNISLSDVHLLQYQSPLQPGQPSHTQFVGIAGVGRDAPMLPMEDMKVGMFGYDRVTTFGSVTDGLSQSMFAVETYTGNGPWAAGGPSTLRGLDDTATPYIGQGRQFGSKDMASVLMGDTSIRRLNVGIDPRVFEKMSTIHGGEPIEYDPDVDF